MSDLIATLEARGFSKVFQGGGCYCMVLETLTRSIVITSEFDGDLPEADSWYVGIYDKAGAYWTESNLVANLDSGTSPLGLIAALDAAGI